MKKTTWSTITDAQKRAARRFSEKHNVTVSQAAKRLDEFFEMEAEEKAAPAPAPQSKPAATIREELQAAGIPLTSDTELVRWVDDSSRLHFDTLEMYRKICGYGVLSQRLDFIVPRHA